MINEPIGHQRDIKSVVRSLEQKTANSIARALGALALVLLFSSLSQAAPITLAWDAGGGSAPAGYVVYYGTASGVLTNQIDVGNLTSATVTGLTAGQHYYFAVKAYDATGVQGALSAEVDQIIAVTPPPPVTVTVPNVVGQLQANGQTAITNATLAFAINTANSATVSAGLVISQAPLGGASALSGSTVTLLVSVGPAAPTLVAVPSVVGQTQAAASSAITGAQLIIGTISTATSATVPSGSVVSQTPVGGASAIVGSAVALTISSGPVAGGGPSAVFVRADSTTQGTWLGVYGHDGYTLAYGAASLPAYAVVTLKGQSTRTFAASTTDRRALQRPAATDRFAAAWYKSTTFSVDVNLTDGLAHQVAVYAVDWDSTTRAQRIDVVDAISGTVLDSRTLTAFNAGRYLVWDLRGHVTLRVTRTGGYNAVLSALMFDSLGVATAAAPSVALTSPSAGGTPSIAPATIALSATASESGGVITRVDYFADSNPTPIGSSTSGPTYTATWSGVAAGIHSVTARATDNGGLTATSTPVLVTVNPASGSGPSAVFVRADPTTQGTWLGVYGLNGYTLANGASSLPAYATVTLTGQAAWTWVASTTDVRALQRPAATDRFAAAWYNGAAFSIDVNLTDGLTHRVAVYAVDWDSTTRAQRIDVVDAISGTVLNSRTLTAFNAGQYLVWDLRGHVTLRVTRTGGSNAAISAVLFD